MNSPNTPLAHLGCAVCVLMAGISGTISAALPALQEWMQQYTIVIPLLFLALLTAAYLLEHALTTSIILLLLIGAAICGGCALGGHSPTGAGLVWQIITGPLCYFATAALVLHYWAETLYRWQLCGIFTLAGVLGALLSSWLFGHSPITGLCAVLFTCSVATFALIILFSKNYYGITSGSRTRSTVLAMLMLLAMPVYKILWHTLHACLYTLCGIGRIIWYLISWI